MFWCKVGLLAAMLAGLFYLEYAGQYQMRIEPEPHVAATLRQMQAASGEASPAEVSVATCREWHFIPPGGPCTAGRPSDADR